MTTGGTASARWTLFEHVIVRSTGFPWDLLEQLRQPASWAAASELAAARGEAAVLRTRAPRLNPPSRGNVARLRSGRTLPHGVTGDERWLDAWNATAERSQRAEQRLAEVFDCEQVACERSLEELAAGDRFRQAVAASSPAVLADLERGRRSARLRRQLASYVQRFCAKNETVSFFGPINYGRVDEHAPTGVSVSWSGPSKIVDRRTHVASWLLAALVDGIAFSDGVAPWLVLRPGAGSRSRLASPLQHADGTSTLLTLAAAGGEDLDEVLAAAREACRSGRATHQLDVPVTALMPLHDLARRLAGLPTSARWAHLDVLAELLRLLDGFGALDASGAVEACTRAHAVVSAHVGDVRPPEGRGQFYADRLPLREECVGDLRLRIGGERAAELRREVAEVLDLLALAAVNRRDQARHRLARRLGDRSVPLWKVVAAAPSTPAPPDDWLTGAVAALVREGDTEIDLSRLDRPPSAGLDDEPLVCSVDLLVAAHDVEAWAAGRYQVALGDIHDTALISPWALQFHPQAVAVDAQLAMAIGRLPHREPLVTVLPARRSGLTPPDPPGVTAELGGASGRAAVWTVPFDELVVHSDGRSARLHAPSLSSDVTLHNGELDTLVHTAFALPRIRALGLGLGTHTPRVRWGRVVVQRERWDLPADELAGLHAARVDRELVREAAELWQRHQLTEPVFASIAGERKPLLVDPASPLLLRGLVNRSRSAPSVVLTEVLPQPSDLWLRDSERRHTCELRCVYARDGGAS